MANRVVKQPNGMYARFSEIVDDFTHVNYTRQDMWVVMRDQCGVNGADEKMEGADKHPERFEEELETIAFVHGKRQANARRKKLSTPVKETSKPLSSKAQQIVELTLAGVDMTTVRWDKEKKGFVKI